VVRRLSRVIPVPARLTSPAAAISSTSASRSGDQTLASRPRADASAASAANAPVLLMRRHRYTGTVSSFLCWTPDPVPLAKLIKVAVTRWIIEEDHQLLKQVSGLDSGQVTTWTSWPVGP
jgi:SRSO17 transposase